MPKEQSLQKILVIGSGPIVIGQAAEFDYAGTQACRALREEGISVVLVNSNPATIMTDPEMADRVYIEPLTVPMLERILSIERPDALLPGLGGQTGLNLAMMLHESGILEKYNVRMLGTSAQSIKKAEDREAFRDTMLSLGEPIVENCISTDVDSALEFADTHGYPAIIRPAYTLGGTGGGIAHNREELEHIAADGLRASRVHQILVEKSLLGWKEIEFEVMRDADGTCIAICDMENVDPMGIHTGDSIVMAPTITLSPETFQMLKQSALRIIEALQIEGGCNVQYALRPDGQEYYVIEVNPRVSRSSALASKATGYPIARVTAKVAIGYRLHEIGGNGSYPADREPTVDYRVCKFPRWPFDKFVSADKGLGTRMKATGEVMAIGANFEEAFLKAVRSLELGLDSLEHPEARALTDAQLAERLWVRDDSRIFMVAEALRRGVSLEECIEKTQLTRWFVKRLWELISLEKQLQTEALTPERLRQAKQLGFTDRAIARWTKQTESEVRALRYQHGIVPSFCPIRPTAAGAEDAYYYSTYTPKDVKPIEAKPSTVVVLGAGPIRIGQGIEFDYASVRCVQALRKRGKHTVIINCNPETVSTDFDTANRLYFEPLSAEDVQNVLEIECPEGVVAQFGGQTAIKLTNPVANMGYTILGTQPEDVDAAEDRERFDQLLTRLDVARPQGNTVYTADEAAAAAKALGYPVLVRPSYVLGGQGMEIAYDEGSLRAYMEIINRNAQEHPILVDKYLMGTEIEVDAICDGDTILIPGIMEHIERAGVHSGDSFSMYPPKGIRQRFQERIVALTRQLSKGLRVRGLVNIQYILYQDDIYVIEVNPRASRTVPYISKITGIPMVDLAVGCMMGESLAEQGWTLGTLAPEAAYVAVKAPVFSLEKLPDVEISLGPEMKSTGEVLGIAREASEALLKALLATGMRIPQRGTILMTVRDVDKPEAASLAREYAQQGFEVYATEGTARALGLDEAHIVPKANAPKPNILDFIEAGRFDLVLNTPTAGRNADRDGFRIRRLAVERAIPCFTSLDTANVLLKALKSGLAPEALQPVCVNDIQRSAGLQQK